MAKKTSEYFDLMKLELENFPELQALASDVNTSQELLNKLTTDSKVAIWDLMTWVQACGVSAVSAEVEHTKQIIIQEIKKRKYGSAEWYVDMAKKFQFGDTIFWSNGLFMYEQLNEELRVVAQAAVVPIQHGLRLKVAAMVNGVLAPSTQSQIDALNSYFSDSVIGIKPAGIRLIITTGPADLLKIYCRVKINPQVLSASGELLAEQGEFPVEKAINNYAQFLPFNGEFNITALEDAIQNAQGVLDVEIDSAESKYGDFAYQTIDMSYIADAGYMMVDPDYPLTDTIEYIL